MIERGLGTLSIKWPKIDPQSREIDQRLSKTLVAVEVFRRIFATL